MRAAENVFFMSYDEVKDFGKNSKNRTVLIDSNHVKDLMNVIKENVAEGKPAFGNAPIIVNKVTNHILDGQNRLAAFVKSVERGIIPNDTKIMVSFEEIHGEENENSLIVSMNTKSKNWTLDDFIESYSKDNLNYWKLKRFCQEHDLCFTVKKNGSIHPHYRYGAAMIKGTTCGSSLKNGSFTVSDDELAIAHNIHEEISQIRNKFGISPDTGIESMVTTWGKFRNRIPLSCILKDKIPQTILQAEKKNSDNWNYIFLMLKDRYESKGCLKEEQACLVM